ncbi:MAG TPA: succinylglutamate desuccinylase/aspartoacylase family protein [Candidatus Acidoferrales bacterium]|jgi:predicted deacylase|nr:succinylglutamate desuccinylase/aspartoacylase family protein [Candidatus Acidoferrales bacterium]
MSCLLRISSRILLLAAVAILLPALRAQQGPFSVGSATAAPGQKATGYLDIPPGSDAATRIPVVVIRGARPGPVLAIVSGAHGTEYASILAVERLITHLDPAAISGTVILVPLVNSGSFLQKVPHVNPVDNKSMNRFYPGKMDGTQTDRVSYIITKQIVERCDYLIDLHGGDLDENLRPYSYWTISGNEKVDRISREMALAFGLDHIIIQTDFPRDPAASRYLSNTALTRGKPAAIAEAGYAGTVEPGDVNALAWGSENIMRYLKMLPGEAPFVQNPVWIEKVETVTSDQEGIFYPVVNRGNYVAAGTEIGYVTDYFGNKILEARSPVAGVVLYVCALPTMNKGGTVANIGVVAAKAP